LIQSDLVTTVAADVTIDMLVDVVVTVVAGNTESMHSIITRLDKTINLNIVI